MKATEIFDDETNDAVLEMRNRMGTFVRSMTTLKQSLITDGDTETVAKQKVTDLNNEIAAIAGKSPIMSYWTGNTQPLIDAVDASLLAHMTADSGAKKTIVTDILDRV